MAKPIRPLVLSPVERTELAEKVAEADQSVAAGAVPGSVVDLLAWLHAKLETDQEYDLVAEGVILDPAEEEELLRREGEIPELDRQGLIRPAEDLFAELRAEIGPRSG